MLIVDDILSCAASAAPAATAVTLGEASMTFRQMQLRSRRLANALLGLGIRRADTVAYWAEVDLDAPPLQFAIGRLGAVFAPLNPACPDSEAAAAVSYLRPRLLIAGPGHAERAGALAATVDVPLALMGATGPGADLDRLAARATDADPGVAPPDEGDVFAVFLTSGSTGRPKGVMISHRATWLRAHAGAQPSTTTGGSGHLVMFPLFHMAGWAFSYYAWSAHQAAHLVPRADAGPLLDAVERHRPASLYCIPAVWERLLSEGAEHDVSSIEWTFVGTSRVGTDLLRRIKERFPGSRTTVSYGSTEICRALSLADHDLFRKPGSVGLPVPGVQARVDGTGELLLRSPTLMSGYLGLPDETAAVMDHGWYRTGDLVETDAEGYFHVVGRRGEMIRTGGEWVAPVEVEAAIAGYPGVAEVAVVGLPDERWGEVVCAAVVMSSGAACPTVEQLRAHLAGTVAAFKHPRRVIPLDVLPRTAATGQVQRSSLVREGVGR